jgi:hypothetical protein
MSRLKSSMIKFTSKATAVDENFKWNELGDLGIAGATGEHEMTSTSILIIGAGIGYGKAIQPPKSFQASPTSG